MAPTTAAPWSGCMLKCVCFVLAFVHSSAVAEMPWAQRGLLRPLTKAEATASGVEFLSLEETKVVEKPRWIWRRPQPNTTALMSLEETVWWPFQSDVFSSRPGGEVDSQSNLLSAAPFNEWLVFGWTIVALLVLDATLLRHFSGAGFKSNLIMLMIWIFAGLCYNVYFGARYGMQAGCDWLTGYFLEWLLSMDNLFVFHLIFKVYKTPKALLHKALFFGIIGAVFFKMIFFLFIGSLIHMVHWLRFVFGGLLIYSGVEAATSDDDEDEDVENTISVRLLRRCLGSRLKNTYNTIDQRLFVWEDGRLCMTMLVHVILCLEFTDILFAVDSVSAKVAQIPNQYIAYSSSVFAMFGLRAMFFIVKDLVDLFELLKYGICIILVFIGLELMLSDFIHLDSRTVCFIIMSVFMVSMMGSVVKKKLPEKGGSTEIEHENLKA